MTSDTPAGTGPPLLRALQFSENHTPLSKYFLQKATLLLDPGIDITERHSSSSAYLILHELKVALQLLGSRGKGHDRIKSIFKELLEPSSRTYYFNDPGIPNHSVFKEHVITWRTLFEKNKHPDTASMIAISISDYLDRTHDEYGLTLSTVIEANDFLNDKHFMQNAKHISFYLNSVLCYAVFNGISIETLISLCFTLAKNGYKNIYKVFEPLPRAKSSQDWQFLILADIPELLKSKLNATKLTKKETEDLYLKLKSNKKLLIKPNVAYNFTFHCIDPHISIATFIGEIDRWVMINDRKDCNLSTIIESLYFNFGYGTEPVLRSHTARQLLREASKEDSLNKMLLHMNVNNQAIPEEFRSQIEEPLYLYKQSHTAPSIEVSVSMLWSALEYATHLRRHESDFECIADWFASDFALSAIHRRLSNVASLCNLFLGEHLDNIKGLSNPVSPAELLSFFQADLAEIELLYQTTLEFPILSYKVCELKETFRQASNLKQTLMTSQKNCTLHLSRIYGARNEAAHSNSRSSNFMSIHSHLEYYVAHALCRGIHTALTRTNIQALWYEVNELSIMQFENCLVRIESGGVKRLFESISPLDSPICY